VRQILDGLHAFLVLGGLALFAAEGYVPVILPIRPTPVELEMADRQPICALIVQGQPMLAGGDGQFANLIVFGGTAAAIITSSWRATPEDLAGNASHAG